VKLVRSETSLPFSDSWPPPSPRATWYPTIGFPTGALALKRLLSRRTSPATAVKLPSVCRVGGADPARPLKIPACCTMRTILAFAPEGAVLSALIALIERLPVTSAVICTAALSTSWLSEPSRRRVPVWAVTRRLCCEPSAPTV
jgi:hypothetical protein